MSKLIISSFSRHLFGYTASKFSPMVTPSLRPLHATAALAAGHSKWQNIKHTKQSKDMARAQLFNRLCCKIRYAIKQPGGSDPHLNRDFANVIQECRVANMPNTTIEKVVKSAQSRKSAEFKFELIGPQDLLVIIEAELDNKNAFRTEMRKILKKFVGWGFPNEGRALSQFEPKSVVRVKSKSGDGNFDQDKVEEIAIEADAEDVRVANDDETVLMFVGEQNTHMKIKAHLEENHAADFEVLESGIELIPFQRIEVSDATLADAEAVLEGLGQLDGINRIYTNI